MSPFSARCAGCHCSAVMKFLCPLRAFPSWRPSFPSQRATEPPRSPEAWEQKKDFVVFYVEKFHLHLNFAKSIPVCPWRLAPTPAPGRISSAPPPRRRPARAGGSPSSGPKGEPRQDNVLRWETICCNMFGTVQSPAAVASLAPSAEKRAETTGCVCPGMDEQQRRTGLTLNTACGLYTTGRARSWSTSILAVVSDREEVTSEAPT